MTGLGCPSVAQPLLNTHKALDIIPSTQKKWQLLPFQFKTWKMPTYTINILKPIHNCNFHLLAPPKTPSSQKNHSMWEIHFASPTYFQKSFAHYFFCNGTVWSPGLKSWDKLGVIAHTFNSTSISGDRGKCRQISVKFDTSLIYIARSKAAKAT